MQTVGQFLARTRRTLWSIGPDSTVRDALVLMADKNIGAVVVTNQDRLVGIFSERDYARKVALYGRSSDETLLNEVMTHDLITVTDDIGIDACMQLMTDHHIRHLPIMKGDKLLGIISIGDVVSEMIVEQKDMIEQLQRYIAG